jgi:hypothetical protein
MLCIQAEAAASADSPEVDAIYGRCRSSPAAEPWYSKDVSEVCKSHIRDFPKQQNHAMN